MQRKASAPSRSRSSPATRRRPDPVGRAIPPRGRGGRPSQPRRSDGMGLERGPKFFRDEQGATIVPAGPPWRQAFAASSRHRAASAGSSRPATTPLRTHKQKLYRRIVGGRMMRSSRRPGCCRYSGPPALSALAAGVISNTSPSSSQGPPENVPPPRSSHQLAVGRHHPRGGQRCPTDLLARGRSAIRMPPAGRARPSAARLGSVRKSIFRRSPASYQPPVAAICCPVVSRTPSSRCSARRRPGTVAAGALAGK